MEYGELCVILVSIGLTLTLSVVNLDMKELPHLEMLEIWGK